MAWWNAVRRREDRAADTASAAPSGPSGTEPAGASSSVPEGWDGGWRRVAPPSLTVARAPLGVSDGLTFRDGLASWQNPAFDSGLGHGLLPSAPMGLVHGVTRPAVQRSEYGGGGPLLLRSLPEPGGDEAADGEGTGSAPAQVQRVVRAEGRTGGAVRRRAGSARPHAPAEPVAGDRAGRVSGPELPVVRRVAVVPNAPSTGTPPRSTAVEPGGAEAVRPRPLGPSLTVARRVAARPVRRVTAVRPVPGAGVEAGAAVTGTGSGAGVASSGSAPGAVQRAPAPGRAPGRAQLGAPMAELPSTATPLAADGPSGPVTAEVRSPSGPVLPVVQRRADAPAAPEAAAGEAVAAPRAVTADPRTGAGAQAPVVQRQADGSGTAGAQAASRPLLPEVRRQAHTGAAEGPEAPRAAEVQPSADPVLPVVQRQAEAPVSAGHELPATEAPKPARAATADAPAPSRPLLPDVQRLVTPGSAADTRPATPDLPATGAAETPRTADAQPTAGPVLPVVQRQTDAADVRPGSEPVPPVIQRRADASEAARPTTTPLLPGVQRRVDAPDASGLTADDGTPASRAAAGPVLPVVQRQAEAPGTGAPAKPLLPGVRPHADAPATTGAELPATAPRPAAAAEPAPGPALPDVQRQTDASARPGATADPATRPGAGSEGPAPTRRTERHGPSGARARGGLGAPLSALPPTAAPRGPVDAGGRPAQPSVQRAAARQDSPLLGTAASTGTPGTVTNSSAQKPVSAPIEGPAPATPLVTRAVAQPAPSAAGAPGVVQRAVSAGPATSGRRTPVVVARALAEPRRSVRATARSLLSARPLTLSTRAPEGMPHPDAPGAPAKPPVVAASWRREPAPEARQAAPQVQRAPASTRPALPVVRPDTPVQRAAAGAALPLTEAQAPPLQASPAPASLTPPGGLPVPVVRVARPAEPAPVLPGGVQVDVVQRDAKGAATGKSATDRPRSASAPAAFRAPGTTAGGKEAAPQDPGVDLEDLARRLLDPLARLLRADMRRGRERAGRPYDGRR
ncbi:hypothetical protein [Streptomyces sp. AM6-12]|uniref:hypothetical protein n=1 Tax=Streptomyces sp. AM6-12 TaxID=3345149 RepID=UPI0037B44796